MKNINSAEFLECFVKVDGKKTDEPKPMTVEGGVTGDDVMTFEDDKD